MDSDQPRRGTERDVAERKTEGPSTDADGPLGEAATRLSRLRARLSRVVATRRGRIVVGGSAVVIGVLAILYVAGAFSVTSEQGRAPDDSARPSEPDGGEQVPVDVASDATFQMTATVSDAIGVDPGTGFVLTSTDDLSVEAVRALLHVEPAVELSVEREREGQYRIVALQPLAAGEVYRFRIEDTAEATPHVRASFAFQTKSPVGVLQTIPRNEATSVPINTGIELTFAQAGVQDVEGHFSIEPAVPGRFEAHGRVTVFVPDGGLAPRTLYTVTVTGGLTVAGSTEVMANDFVLQFETGDTERTGEALPQFISFSRRVAESATTEAPALETSTYETAPVRLAIEVYRFDTMDAFVSSLEEYERVPAWASVTRETFVTDTAGLTRAATFDADLQRHPESDKTFIQFPAVLPAGFYLVRSEYNGQPMQAWLQVTDIATYAVFSEDRTLVWANDVSTQAPIAGARVDFVGAGVSGETGSDGTLMLVSPEPVAGPELHGNMIVTAPDGRVAVVPVSPTDGSVGGYPYFGYPFYGQRAADDYWAYLSVDRPLYLPTDTIRFWGIARPRDTPGPRAVTVQLSSFDYTGYDYQPVVVAEAVVETSGLGTFTGELAVAGLSPSSYDLTASVDGQVVGSAQVMVQTYTKPAYQIDVTPDRRAAFAGDAVTFSIDATFLEGSPVPGLELKYSGSAEGQLVTDEAGHATVTVTASTGSEPSYGPGETSLWVTPVRAEEGEIVGEGHVRVHPASVTASAQAEVEGAQGVISGTVHHVDLARSGEVDANGMDDVSGEIAGGVTVSFAITDVSYRETEIGEYYDFIAKITRKQYRYEEVLVALGTFNATTDASGAFRYAFPAESGRDYRIDMRASDDRGRTESHQLWVSGSMSRMGFESGSVYLRSVDQPSAGFFGGDQVAVDTPVSLSMHRGAGELPSGGVNRYLFIAAQDGIHDYAVRAESRYDFTFGEDDVPNVSVTGVWFNGDTYVPVNYGYELRLDAADRALDIEIAPDKERYEPGEEAGLDVVVTDQHGNPQPGTEVNLSVVDEALFQVPGAGQCACVLQAVYSPMSPGILRTYASHQYPSQVRGPGFGATTGGPRQSFADVAFFGSVTTDGDGRASITVELPDNLTSWRVTAQGFNDRLMAGSATQGIAVGLPFFADVTLSDEYLVTDRPNVRLRSYGAELDPGDIVTFSVSAPSLGIDTPLEVTAPAFQAANLPLPALREGEHEILVEARSGDAEDSLVRTIRVVSSRLVAAQTRFFELEPGMGVEGSADGPTRVVLSDRERGRYFGALQQLTWGYGDRLDQQLARDVAAELLATFYDDVEAHGAPFDASAYQTPEGGIALFPYAGQDLALSARAAAVAPDRFGTAGLTRMFLGVLSGTGEPGEGQAIGLVSEGETRERQAIALYGLAALGEPVLLSLQALLLEPDLTWREQLYAGLGLVEMGDDASARQVYQALLDAYGESVAPAYRLNVDDNQDATLEATSLAAILGGGLGDALAPQLFDYTTQNATTDILLELEQISYLANALPRLSSAPVRVAYTVDGERTELALERGETHAIQLTPDQLQSLRLEPLAGAAGVASFYTAPIDPTSLAVDPDVAVTRTYSADPTALREGELVQVTLTAEFGALSLDGCYQLTDVLPSGLRPVVRNFAWGMTADAVYPYRIDGQRVSFCVSNAPLNRVATYWARVVSAGEYTAEPALIQSMQSTQRINFSGADRVVIH